jgi:hypothetical protein
MIRLFIFALLAAFSAQEAYAIKLSAVGAIVSSQPAETTVLYDSKMSVGAGALLEFRIFPLLAMELGALSIKRKSVLAAGATETVTTKELYEFPVLLRLNLPGPLSFGIGGYYAHYQGKIAEETSTVGGNTVGAEYSYESRSATTTDYGLATSLALAFPMAPLMRLLFDARYTMGLKDNDIRATNTLKYNDLQFLAGLQVGF